MRISLPFRPSLWPTMFTLPAVLFMAGLSIWQIDRLQWKSELIADRKARMAAEEVALPPAGSDLKAFEFRRTAITGAFRHDLEMLLGARSLRGNVGYHLVTPFSLETGESVFVNRGFVPQAARDAAAREAGQIAGTATIQGVIRRPQARAWMQPENEPERGQWFYMDLAAMAKASGIDARTDLYIEAGPAENPGGLPMGGQTKIDLPNDHLQYAITWALLAAALIVIYVVYHLKLEREKRGQG